MFILFLYSFIGKRDKLKVKCESDRVTKFGIESNCWLETRKQ